MEPNSSKERELCFREIGDFHWMVRDIEEEAI
jgi:hypothetical protein